MSKVVIFGTGDYAQVAHHFLTHDSDHTVVAFAVHAEYVDCEQLRGLPVVAFEELDARFPPPEHRMLVAVGPGSVNEARARIVGLARDAGYAMISHVSPHARVAEGVPIGAGSVVFGGCVLEPFSSVGDNVVLWTGCVVAHHSHVGNHSFLAPRVTVSGRVMIGDYCFIGVNATLRDNISLGASCVVGAGAIIMQDTEPRSVHSATGAKVADKDSSRVKL